MLLLFLAFWGGFVYMITNPSRRAKEARSMSALGQEQAGALLGMQDFVSATPDEMALLVTQVFLTMVPPTPTPAPTELPKNTPTLTATPTVTPGNDQTFQSELVYMADRCENCASYRVQVRLTNYWPNNLPTAEEIAAGNGSRIVKTFNCWQYDLDRQWCVSPMTSELPWESFIGIAAACPYDWPLGTVLEFPVIGRSYTCLDRGTMVCQGSPAVCDVDLLMRSKPAWDGQIFEAIVKIPGW